MRPDQPQAVRTAGLEALGDDALDDRADGVPGDAHQPGDRRLGHLLGQERHDVFEVAVKRGPRAHGTASTRTPQSGHSTRRRRATT